MASEKSVLQLVDFRCQNFATSHIGPRSRLNTIETMQFKDTITMMSLIVNVPRYALFVVDNEIMEASCGVSGCVGRRKYGGVPHGYGQMARAPKGPGTSEWIPG